MNRISKHISYAEAIHSQTAIRKGINNTPNKEQLENMQLLAEKVFEPLREKFGAIRISSFFRSVKLNKAIGGSATSQHCTGEAMDIQAMGVITNKQLFSEIKDKLDFDQLIAEFKTDNDLSWVHVSYSKTHNRKQILIATRIKGKVVYLPYSFAKFKEIYR